MSARILPGFYKRLLTSYHAWQVKPKRPGITLKPLSVSVDIPEMLALTYCIPNPLGEEHGGQDDKALHLCCALGSVNQLLVSSDHLITFAAA